MPATGAVIAFGLLATSASAQEHATNGIGIIQAAPIEEVVEALRGRITDDFVEERIAEHRGWWLSSTELRLFEDICLPTSLVALHEAAADPLIQGDEQQAGTLETRVAELQAEVERLEAEIEGFEQSRSWRITAPLRWMGGRWREFRGE